MIAPKPEPLLNEVFGAVLRFYTADNTLKASGAPPGAPTGGRPSAAASYQQRVAEAAAQAAEDGVLPGGYCYSCSEELSGRKRMLLPAAVRAAGSSADAGAGASASARSAVVCGACYGRLLLAHPAGLTPELCGERPAVAAWSRGDRVALGCGGPAGCAGCTTEGAPFDRKRKGERRQAFHFTGGKGVNRVFTYKKKARRAQVKAAASGV
ncbi:hypothetical protein HYH03_016813 [Edaphochlamys debaryana]|uniref:Uncharacterized protein n=1 Tax=Edaphochlamys debaryana TaxID=47281 RepID=A0A835XQR3_9CHLO|nr:hypothetical protein HYH03_016813 [Edaphochlamys debaryana]|eukprot:KAG2484399.1 hypothetical protein HYH03_016813 [Edaphochlamys debaryana]